MKHALLFTTLFVYGCGGLQDVSESLKKTETTDKALDVKNVGVSAFNGPSPDVYNPVVSGNNINVNIVTGQKKDITHEQNSETEIEKTVNSEFSADYYIEQVSLTGWILILALLIGLIIVIRRSAAGKALDKLVGSGIDRLNDQLTQTTPGSDLHTHLMQEMSELRKKKKKD